MKRQTVFTSNKTMAYCRQTHTQENRDHLRTITSASLKLQIYRLSL